MNRENSPNPFVFKIKTLSPLFSGSTFSNPFVFRIKIPFLMKKSPLGQNQLRYPRILQSLVIPTEANAVSEAEGPALLPGGYANAIPALTPLFSGSNLLTLLF
ncbi:MAG: hypothetical protein WBD10_03830, partial [Acidobacteriaceae bacterium]